MSISLYTREGGYEGFTHTHELPRRGELILWRKRQWRVIDVAHPTEDQKGKGIHYPHVLVREEMFDWITEEL